MAARSMALRIGAIAVIVAGAIYILQEGARREAAVDAALAAQSEEVEAETAAAVDAAVSAAVAKAVAETEARVIAAQPTLPDIDTRLQSDPATLALFPDGAFLLEVGDADATAACSDIRPNALWVDLTKKPPLRATVRRQVVAPLSIVIGWMTLGLSAFGGPKEPIQTVFAAGTEGAYTTLVLGALRAWSDAELAAPQVRVTLYRIDPHTLGVVEWVPMDIPPAARPDGGPQAFATIYRRCAYVGGEIVDL